MKTMIIVSLALVAIIFATVTAGEMECTEQIVEFVCGPDFKDVMKEQLEKLSPECKAKAAELAPTLKPKHDEICAAKKDWEGACKKMKDGMVEIKAKMGDCMPKEE